jgi:hypothetical protein
MDKLILNIEVEDPKAFAVALQKFLLANTTDANGVYRVNENPDTAECDRQAYVLCGTVLWGEWPKVMRSWTALLESIK